MYVDALIHLLTYVIHPQEGVDTTTSERVSGAAQLSSYSCNPFAYVLRRLRGHVLRCLLLVRSGVTISGATLMGSSLS